MSTDPLAAALLALDDAAARRRITRERDLAAMEELKRALRAADRARASLAALKQTGITRGDLIERSGMSRPTAYKLFPNSPE